MNKPKTTQPQPDRTLPPKWVKRAQMWVVTKFTSGKQTQEWFKEKPK